MMMSLTGYIEPMVMNLENRMELVNEIFTLVFTYHLYQFTNFIVDINARSMVGKSLIYLTSVNVFLNIIAVSSHSV